MSIENFVAISVRFRNIFFRYLGSKYFVPKTVLNRVITYLGLPPVWV